MIYQISVRKKLTFTNLGKKVNLSSFIFMHLSKLDDFFADHH